MPHHLSLVPNHCRSERQAKLIRGSDVGWPSGQWLGNQASLNRRSHSRTHTPPPTISDGPSFCFHTRPHTRQSLCRRRYETVRRKNKCRRSSLLTYATLLLLHVHYTCRTNHWRQGTCCSADSGGAAGGGQRSEAKELLFELGFTEAFGANAASIAETISLISPIHRIIPFSCFYVCSVCTSYFSLFSNCPMRRWAPTMPLCSQSSMAGIGFGRIKECLRKPVPGQFRVMCESGLCSLASSPKAPFSLDHHSRFQLLRRYHDGVIAAVPA